MIASSWVRNVPRIFQSTSIFLLFLTFFIKFLKGAEFFYIRFGFYPSRLIYTFILLFLLASLFEKETRVKFSEFSKQIWKMELDDNIDSKYKFKLTFLNFVSLGIFLLVLFLYSQIKYFTGTDGTLQLSLNQQHKKLGDSPFYFSSNFLQGLGGNIPFPFNHVADPGYYVGNLGDKFNIPIALTVWALLLSFSVYLLSKSMRLPPICGYVSSWLAPMLIVIPSPLVFTLIPTLTPHMLTTICITNIWLALIILQTKTIVHNFLKAFAIFLILIYYLSSNPTFLILSLPVIIVATTLRILNDKSLRNRQGIIWTAVPYFLALVSGAFSYLVGIFAYTSILVFNNEHGVTPKPIQQVSVLFSIRPLVRIEFILALIGFILIYKSIKLKVNVVSQTFLLLMVFFVSFGLIYYFAPNLWLGPAPFYFEFMLWSGYVVSISYFLTLTLNFFVSDYKKLVQIVVISLVFLSTYFIVPSLHRDSEGLRYFESKSNSKVLTELKDVYSQRNLNIIGRTYMITSYNNTNNLRWEDIDLESNKLFTYFYSDFRQGTLWIKNIPTLFEVNQLITPRSYYILTNTLARKNDIQTRNFVLTRDYNEKVLQLLGISHVLSDNPLVENNNLKLVTSDIGRVASIYLYKHKNYNSGNFYASRLEVTNDLFSNRSIDLLQKPVNGGTFFTEKFITKSNLIAPEYSKLSFSNSTFRLRAETQGESAVVLPVEYSHCFNFVSKPNNGVYKTFPVNGALLGVLFQKEIDVEFSYKFGPFVNQNCRVKDFLEFRASGNNGF
jgi:hypothetical protein